MRYFALLLIVLALSGCGKWGNYFEKQKLKAVGGKFDVTVYSPDGNVIKTYMGNGYAEFEEKRGGSILVFTDLSGVYHRISAPVQLITVDYK